MDLYSRKQSGKDSEAPPLTITKKAVVPHWFPELLRHVKPEYRLKILVLERPVSS